MAYTTINKSSEHFNTKLYTGNGSTQSITGVGFQPDFVWVKDRSNAQNHGLRDAVRGATKRLVSSDTAAENTQTQGLSSFDSDGFSLGTGVDVNANSDNYASWNWKANGAGSANTDGTINSTVSANTTSGFSIVSYAGGGSDSDTVGHGLGVTPAMVIVKNRDNTNGWLVSHQGLTSESYNVSLNNTNGEQTTSSHGQGIVTNKTSSTFGFSSGGVGDENINNSGHNYIAYCFSEVKGYSKFGSYTGNGNGNADGTFIYTGFKPAFFMYKSSSGAYNWIMQDNKRANSFNEINADLRANASDAEATSTSYNDVDFLSNGIKLREDNNDQNASGGTYIYMAFAEAPLVGTNNVPCTAR